MPIIMMAQKRRQKHVSYGNQRNERVADPTPAEIQQRIAEVEQRRLEADEEANRKADQLQGAILGALHESGGLPAKTLETILGATAANVQKALKALELAGLASPKGNGTQIVWFAVTSDHDHDDSEVGLVPNMPILKAFRQKGESFTPKPEPKPSAGPLANIVRQIKGGMLTTSKSAPKKTSVTASIDFQTLQNCDALYESCKSMAKTTPLDAAPMARALLRSLLRLAWAKASGRPETNPLSESIAMKLYNRGHVSKNSMRRINAAIADNAKTDDVLQCCKALLIWIAADEPQRID
tara:strand:- start:7150 stop:8037 length:888 start_codon:yes stop_codon:yes gene_type:complete